MKFIKQTFEGKKVLLDGQDFIDCTFTKCHIEYAGFMGVTLDGNRFTECTWGFTGAAANAIGFMAALYAQGGDAKSLVERTFDNVRSGKVATTKH